MDFLKSLFKPGRLQNRLIIEGDYNTDSEKKRDITGIRRARWYHRSVTYGGEKLSRDSAVKFIQLYRPDLPTTTDENVTDALKNLLGEKINGRYHLKPQTYTDKEIAKLVQQKNSPVSPKPADSSFQHASYQKKAKPDGSENESKPKSRKHASSSPTKNSPLLRSGTHQKVTRVEDSWDITSQGSYVQKLGSTTIERGQFNKDGTLGDGAISEDNGKTWQEVKEGKKTGNPITSKHQEPKSEFNYEIDDPYLKT